MFNSLKGVITGKFPKQLFIETQGIEWALWVPDSCLDDFPGTGSEGRVYTWLNHYENGMDLYGFATVEQRMLFLDLLKVDGVGPKGALKIMSSVRPEDLVKALENGDLAVLEKVQGIGKKTAAKMMLTLQGKLTVPQENSFPSNSFRNSPFAVVVSSLVDMGYERIKCEQTISELYEQLKADQMFISKSQTEKEDLLFKKAVVEMAK